MYILQVKSYNAVKWHEWHNKERAPGEIVNSPYTFIRSNGSEIQHGYVVYNKTSARLFKTLRQAREYAVQNR